ncbi:hypothetical protein FBZ93_101116 [Bradyrhizobium macuxiense]|uniref:Uncharacterized protein n=1 Tax=Bradyrhizobium macuxiense TaxID=1755647 RepID=A0A560MHI0_9BRAD|nr:hypothetical protein FBZ93_101116 [Bradyrhizobium macuxiense]
MSTFCGVPQLAQLASPAKAGDPVFQRRQRVTEKPRRTGYPAFAGHDAECEAKSPYSAGLVADGAPDEAFVAAAFFSTMRTAMMAPS